jgi:hypothetical protein
LIDQSLDWKNYKYAILFVEDKTLTYWEEVYW